MPRLFLLFNFAAPTFPGAVSLGRLSGRAPAQRKTRRCKPTGFNLINAVAVWLGRGLDRDQMRLRPRS
jgi:hypothetical protein